MGEPLPSLIAVVEEPLPSPIAVVEEPLPSPIAVVGEPGELRQARGYFLHKAFSSPVSYHYSSRVHRPNVNFVANGRPFKVLVNPKDHQKQPPTTTRAPLTTTLATTSHSSPPTAPTNSPLIWLTNRFFFNGLAHSLVSLPSGWMDSGWGLRSLV